MRHQLFRGRHRIGNRFFSTEIWLSTSTAIGFSFQPLGCSLDTLIIHLLFVEIHYQRNVAEFDDGSNDDDSYYSYRYR